MLRLSQIDDWAMICWRHGDNQMLNVVLRCQVAVVEFWVFRLAMEEGENLPARQ
jgi:hypothetical protein